MQNCKRVKSLYKILFQSTAFDTEGVWKFEGRKDIAVIWDIRIKPEFRRIGVGKNLIEKAIKFFRKRKYKYLKVETQNVNCAGIYLL